MSGLGFELGFGIKVIVTVRVGVGVSVRISVRVSVEVQAKAVKLPHPKHELAEVSPTEWHSPMTLQLSRKNSHNTTNAVSIFHAITNR